MECRACGKRFSPASGLFAESDYCSWRCRQESEEGEARSGIANLARSVSAEQAGSPVPAAVKEARLAEGLFDPFLGEQTRLPFPPARYTTSRQAPLPPPRPLPKRASPSPQKSTEAQPRALAARERPEAPAPSVAFGTLAADAETEVVEQSSWLSKGIVVGVLAVVIGFLGFTFLFNYFQGESAGTAAAASSETPTSAEWTPGWATAPGGDEISVHTESLEWSDYRIEHKVSRYLGLQWIYRASDPENYYVLQLSPGRYDNVMKLTRRTVVDGVARDPVETDVPVGGTGGDAVTVKLEARGSEFRLFLGGEWAGKWMESDHGRGGFGVVGKTQESIVANPVRVSQLR